MREAEGRPARRWLLVLTLTALFVGLAVFQTWSAWGTRQTVLIGGGDEPDWTGTAWTWWWTFYAIRHGLNPIDCPVVFHPIGQSPVAWYNLLDGLIGGPLMYAFGPATGYNATVVVALASCGLGGWTLARLVGASPLAAVLAGIAIQTSNYVLYEVQAGRISQAFLVFWLVGLGMLDRLLRGRDSRRLAIAAGLAVALTHLEYWFYGLFLTFAAIILLVAWAKRFDGEIGRRLLLAAGVAIGVVAPFVISLVRRFDQLPGVGRAAEAWIDYGALDRDEFSLANAIHESSGLLWVFRSTTGQLADRSLAAPLLLLAFAGLLYKPLGRLRWLALLAFGWVMALGPYVRWFDGTVLPLRLPYLAFYDWFPFFSRLWWPGRFAPFVVAGAAVLAALHVDLLSQALERWRAGSGRLLTVGITVATALWILETSPYMPLLSDPPRSVDSRVYPMMDGPILTTPVLGTDSRARHLLWFQIVHEQPILTGLGAHLEGHRPPGYEDYVRGNSLLRALAAVSAGEVVAGPVRAADVDALIDDGFRWAVVDARAFLQGWQPKFGRAFSQVFMALWGPPDVRGSSASAWRVEPITGDITLPYIEPVRVVGPGATPNPRGGAVIDETTSTSR